MAYVCEIPLEKPGKRDCFAPELDLDGGNKFA